MRRIALLLILLCAARADAHCGVACNSFYTPVYQAIAIGVPVATVSPTYVQYAPTPNITVNVSNAPIDSAALANAIQTGIVQGLSAPPPNQPTPTASTVPSGPPPAPTQPTPPQPLKAAGPATAILSGLNNCAECHSPQGKAQKGGFDVSNLAGMTSIKLDTAVGLVLDQKMPPANHLDGTPIPKLNADQAGDVLHSLHEAEHAALVAHR